MQTVSDILGVLARASKRPRYAFMLLGLISEAADPEGRLGPVVGEGGQTVREWLAAKLIPLTAHHRRRRALLERLRAQRPTDSRASPEVAEAQLLSELEERAQRAVMTNISRAVTELEQAGLLERHYAGYRTNHRNRGGRRHAVYILRPETLAALRRRSMLV